MSIDGKSAMLTRRVERFLKTQRLPAGANILIGLSGGPDSTCLASILSVLADKLKLTIACACLDHGLRPLAERTAEAELVRRFCETRGITLYTDNLPEGALAAEAARTGLGLEATARQTRQHFFAGLREKHGFDFLALAHTLDDQIETILWRIFQGSGAGGIRGINPRNGWIIRPLLGTSRREIMAYLETERIEFSMDSTNASTRFLRNKIRHSLVPALKDIFPGMGRSLTTLTSKMRAVDSYLKARSAEVIRWEKTGNGVKTGADGFFAAPAAIRMYALYEATALVPSQVRRRKPHALPYRFIAPLLTV
jgi:tRNA(Ile)-lysidine synthetase-like protein